MPRLELVDAEHIELVLDPEQHCRSFEILVATLLDLVRDQQHAEAASHYPSGTRSSRRAVNAGWTFLRAADTQVLHGYLGDQPPAEFEATVYAAHQADQTLVETQ